MAKQRGFRSGQKARRHPRKGDVSVLHRPARENSRNTMSLPFSRIDGFAADPAPPAFWRLIELGESSQLITPAHRDAVLDAFAVNAQSDGPVARALAPFKCGPIELYLLVALCLAPVHGVSPGSLQEEAAADAATVDTCLARLHERGAVSIEGGAHGERQIVLTPFGRRLTAQMAFRTLNAVAHARP
jgi:hypothetical protein